MWKERNCANITHSLNYSVKRDESEKSTATLYLALTNIVSLQLLRFTANKDSVCLPR